MKPCMVLILLFSSLLTASCGDVLEQTGPTATGRVAVCRNGGLMPECRP